MDTVIDIPTNTTVTTKSSVAITLSSTDKQKAIQIAQSHPLTAIEDKDVVLFGSERQKAMGSKLDVILGEITKGDSPLLFELFRQLKKGVTDAKIDEMETQIRAQLAANWWTRLLDSVGLSSVSKRIEKANDRINSMLTSKSKTLLDLMRDMEGKVQTEVMRLITDSSRIKHLGDEYRQNVTDFSIMVDAGRQILEQAKIESQKQTAAAATSGDPLEVEKAKTFEQKVNLMESRVLVLETIYTKAPTELESLRLSQGASLSTLSETANSALEEFNDIKSALIKLSVLHQIQSVQQLNQERRTLRNNLQKHNVDLLGKVAVDAAQLQGKNRLEDAELLLSITSGIKSISDKVIEEGKNNQQRFAEARTKLGEARQLLSIATTK